MTTDSQKQERRGAKVYGGVVNSGSGNTTGHKNDVRTVDRSIEFKITKAASYRLKLDDLKLAEKEALLDGRDFLFGIDFKAPEKVYRYVVMPEWDYLNQKEQVEDYERAICGLQDQVSYLITHYLPEGEYLEW